MTFGYLLQALSTRLLRCCSRPHSTKCRTAHSPATFRLAPAARWACC